MPARCVKVRPAQAGCRAFAAATAWSTCAGVPRTIVPTSSSGRAGFLTSIRSVPSTGFPSINMYSVIGASALRGVCIDTLPDMFTFRRVAAWTSLLIDFEHDAETRFAAHHAIIRRLCLLERKNLVHRCDAVELAEQKGVFGVGGCPRIPTPH